VNIDKLMPQAAVPRRGDRQIACPNANFRLELEPRAFSTIIMFTTRHSLQLPENDVTSGRHCRILQLSELYMLIKGRRHHPLNAQRLRHCPPQRCTAPFPQRSRRRTVTFTHITRTAIQCINERLCRTTIPRACTAIMYPRE
jgi:hypothetical protein